METVKELVDTTPLESLKIANILVIDDEQGPRESIKMVLGDEHRCLFAQNGREGLEILDQEPIDLVILDLKMPGLSGIETLELIRSKDSEVEVVLLTGFGTLETAQKAIRLGIFDYMTKPFDVTHLRNVVSGALERKFSSEVSRNERDDLESMIQNVQDEISNSNHLAHVGQISAGVIHQMKNPLSVIMGYTQMLAKLFEGSDEYKLNDHSQKYLSIIESETVRCSEIASKLLRYSKTGESEQRQCPVNEVIQNVQTLIMPQCSLNGITLEVESSQPDLKVKIIQNDLHEVVLNLIFNSIQAMEKGGRLVLSGAGFTIFDPPDDLTSGEHAFIQESNLKEIVAITVTDTGDGIPSQFIEKIFEPFFTTKPGEKGTGLGLNICREKMKKNGGHVCVPHTCSDGTTMRILLPAV
jgi:two-component system, sensor histidine kinase and response regulator